MHYNPSSAANRAALVADDRGCSAKPYVELGGLVLKSTSTFAIHAILAAGLGNPTISLVYLIARAGAAGYTSPSSVEDNNACLNEYGLNEKST